MNSLKLHFITLTLFQVIFQTLYLTSQAQTPVQTPAEAPTQGMNIPSNEIMSCESLSDQFCSELYSEKSFGNLEKKGIKIYLGSTPQEALSLHRRYDIQALIDAENHFSKDLQKPLKPLLRELKRHLSKEVDSNIWFRKLSTIQRNIDAVVQDTAEARTFKKRPELKKLKWNQYQTQDRIDLQKDLTDLENHIVIEKYKNHPHWIRATQLFPKVKTYLIEALKESPLSKEMLEIMVNRLSSVEIVLPIEDSKGMKAASACERSPINAFYFDSVNKFTICPGYFNALQSEGAMFGVMAHELSHSIDAFSIRSLEYKKSDLFQLTNDLSQNQGNLDCSTWEKLKTKAFAKAPNFYELPKELTKITQCFVDPTNLTPINLKTLETPLQSFSKSSMDGMASNYYFSVLSSSQIFKLGKKIKNDYFFHPDLLLKKDNQYSDYNSKNGNLHTTHLYAQELKCALEEFLGNKTTSIHKTNSEISSVQEKFETLPKDQQTTLFERALARTSAFIPNYYLYTYAIFGVETSALQSYNLSRPSVEFWADWLSLKASYRFLKELKTLEEKRNNFLAASAIFCEPSGLDHLVPNFLKIEKSFSMETHPESRTRRLSFFTPEIQKLLECKIKDPELLKIKQCEL
ncbi:MAG TPA: hypothetical protein PLJ21_00580 [Pseudobdellovibrionaceae bacterium]|nr:hypothetical protein [Pseudobdellovibrionaceae bacterium]